MLHIGLIGKERIHIARNGKDQVHGPWQQPLRKFHIARIGKEQFHITRIGKELERTSISPALGRMSRKA